MKSANSQFQDESEDDILAKIQEESLRYYNEVELPRRAAEEAEKRKQTLTAAQTNTSEPQAHCSKVLNIGPSQSTPVKDVFYKGNKEGAGGFHLAAGQSYVYPTNYPIRKYQKSIIHSALFHNTLVSLPTGLGKTFIAAVVMYNYYRWFPQGKIVFMAPTRPLVAQQIRACHDIMAIPINNTIEMTGTMNPNDRLQHWKSKRVFFLTPQVMQNDLRSGNCPAKLFKCVVIDEAHRATKEYAFCVVIRELEQAGAIFRVLALSATPGSSVKAVGDVVQNLRIAVLELRGEDSEDVMRYTHAKLVEPVSLSLPQHVIQFKEQFLLIFEKYASNLREARLITSNVQNLTKFQLLKSCEKLRGRPPAGMSKQKLGATISLFTVCMTLAHGLELLQTYGLRAFYHYFTGGCEDEENRKAAFTRLNQDMEFHELLNNLNKLITQPMDQTWSHPKHEHLVKILKEHFSRHEQEGTATKVIIFCQFRVVVSEVYELLSKVHPLIKPVMFIGQGLGKDKSGLPQKKQIEVMKQFREGVSNVLIATCVAEEGLDIGAVDLLVLMDTQRSPVRLVQRLGRTGRHRAGRCVVLLTAGKEVQKFNEAMATRKNFINNIQKSKYLDEMLYKDEPAMIPPHLSPKIQLVHINVPERITPGKSKKQSDIRASLVAKLNDSEETNVTESPFLSKEEFIKVKEELGTAVINFDSIKFTDNEYLHHRVNECQMSSEELFANKFVCHSAFVDWNRVSHDIYVVPHSADSLSMCDLLNRVEAAQLGLETHQGMNSQMNMSSLFPNKKKGGKIGEKVIETAKQKKKGKEEKHGMDIRECMAIAADKARLTQEKFSNKNPVEVLDLTQPSEEPIPPEISQVQCANGNEITEKCSFCKHKEDTFQSIPVFDERPFPFSLNQLLSVEKLVQNLTLEDVNNIDISKLFMNDEGFTKKGMQDRILNVKEANFSHLFEGSAFANHAEIREDGRKSERSVCVYSNEKNECVIDNINSNSPMCSKEESKQECFDIEDIFSDDDDFKLDINTKTSTPLKQLIVSPKTSCAESTVVRHTAIGNNTSQMKRLNPFRIIDNASNLNTKTDPIFKIPYLKLSLHAPESPSGVKLGQNANISCPESPILSGQVTTSSPSSKLKRRVLFPDNQSSLCKNRPILSPESPILSGHITSARSPNSKAKGVFVESCGKNHAKISSPESPVLSGQITNARPTRKLERKALFPDNLTRFDNNRSISNSPSPLLSGQITTSTALKPVLFPDAFKNVSNNTKLLSPESPILSGQIIKASPHRKLDRKALFTENYSDKEIKDKLFSCKPLNICSNVPCNEVNQNTITVSQLFESEPPTENIKDMSVSELFEDSFTEENKPNISVSQLFSDEEEEDGMNDSSMYTISQMVAKVAEMSKKNKNPADLEAQKEATDNLYKNNSIQFGGSDDEDSIFENIDLDQLTAVKQGEYLKTNGPSVQDCSTNLTVIKDCDKTVNTVNNPTESVCKVKSVGFSDCSLKPKSVPDTNDKLSGDSFSSIETTFHNNVLHKSISEQQRKPKPNWLSCSKFQKKSMETKSAIGSTPAHSMTLEADSDSNSDASLFVSPVKQNMKGRSEKKERRLAQKKRKEKGFVEFEADVSGAPQSSDEENTSGLDDLDNSFINDQTEMPVTPSRSTSRECTIVDMKSHYLQSVKSPFHKAGGYKIPAMSDAVLAMDVYSQAVQSDHDSYLNIPELSWSHQFRFNEVLAATKRKFVEWACKNIEQRHKLIVKPWRTPPSFHTDSFCCDATEIPVDNDPSILEVAEMMLREKRKLRKRKRKVSWGSSDSSFESERISNKKIKKRRQLSSSSSSDSDSKFVHNIKSVKRKNPITDSSPENLLRMEVQIRSRKDRKCNLLTSEDSDSDKTP